jgi:hypothetical protein
MPTALRIADVQCFHASTVREQGSTEWKVPSPPHILQVDHRPGDAHRAGKVKSLYIAV